MYAPGGFMPLMLNDDGVYEPAELKAPSTWLRAPYFLIYFVMFIINSVVWPLQMMERACISELPQHEASIHRYQFTQHGYNQVGNSCISNYVSNASINKDYISSNVNNITLDMMILVAFTSGVVSLIAYFVIWKPLLSRCRSVAVFLPPLCMIAQCFIMIQAQSISSFQTYKYTIFAGVLLPSLHSHFQGVLLLLYHMSEVPEVKTNREIMATRLDGSHFVIFLSIVMAGSFVAGCFDLSYNLVFFLQFTLGSVNLMYALTLLPTNGPCLGGVEEEEEEEEEENGDCEKDTEKDDSGNVSDSSTEEFFMGNIAKGDNGQLLKRAGLLKEAPMIFSETSYKKELTIIIEICVFTVAMVSDLGISGLYFVQSPYPFNLRIFGGCIAAQGFMKVAGWLIMKTATHFVQVKHGTLIALALLNYTGYYIALSLATSKVSLTVVMFTNVFGGLALPTIFSFIKVNFKETAEAVLEISIISSLVVTMGFSALEYFIYEKTRAIFQGIIFALTASLLAISGIIIVATYFSTITKNQRKSKFFADKLLNSSN